MVGFVREGRKSKSEFNDRMQREADVLAMVAAKKAAAAKDGAAPEGAALDEVLGEVLGEQGLRVDAAASKSA